MYQINNKHWKTFHYVSKKALTICLTCVLAFSPSIQSSAKKLVQDNLQNLSKQNSSEETYPQTSKIAKKAANSLIIQYGCSSVQYAVIHKGEIVLSDSVGSADQAKKKAPTKDTIYGIGSISKLFTTVAIMQLNEKGVLDLDKPVVDYIKDFTMADERYKDITVRMLVNHSSGLMGNLIGNSLLFYDPDSINTDNFLNLLSKQRLKAAPGSYSVYSNDGFTLAEILIQRVTHSTYTEYIEENICKPLNLTNTKSPQSSFPRLQMAKSYLNNVEVPLEYPNFIGAGGLYSTAEDLCHFLDMFMNDTKILSQDSIKAMAMPEYRKGLWGNDGENVINYGLGWDCINLYPFDRYNIQAFEKGGDTSYYHGCVTMLPDSEYGVAILSSGGTSKYAQLLGNTILLNVLKEKNIIPEILPDKTGEKLHKIPMPDSYKDFSGIYANNNSVFKLDFTDNNSLKLLNDQDSEDGSEFFYDGKGIFKDDASTLELSFKKLNNGKTYLNLKTYDNYPGIGSSLCDILYAEKLEENNVSISAQEAWNKRCGKTYYIINEKYSSVTYNLMPSFTFPKKNFLEGYVINSAIVDENHLETRIQIPMDFGRDLLDFNTFVKDGIEYLQANSYLCIEDKSIKNLNTKKKFNITIDADGYAKWFNLPNKSKKITVNIPKNASIAIYNKNHELTFLSTIHKDKLIELPKGGMIMFAGNAFSTFTVQYK